MHAMPIFIHAWIYTASSKPHAEVPFAGMGYAYTVKCDVLCDTVEC